MFKGNNVRIRARVGASAFDPYIGIRRLRRCLFSLPVRNISARSRLKVNGKRKLSLRFVAAEATVDRNAECRYLIERFDAIAALKYIYIYIYIYVYICVYIYIYIYI